MITSKIGNAFVIILGLFLISIPVLVAATERTTSAGVLFFGGLGLWCLLGAFANLRAPEHFPELASYRYAGRAVAVMVCLLLAGIVGVVGLSKAEDSRPLEAILLFSASGLLPSFVISCAILLYHRVTREENHVVPGTGA